jgi:hypothetical protein
VDEYLRRRVLPIEVVYIEISGGDEHEELLLNGVQLHREQDQKNLLKQQSELNLRL